MSISKQRWIKTGDPRSGDEVYDDEGNEITCTECGDALEGKTPNERLVHALLGCHQHCLEAMTPEDHAEYIRKGYGCECGVFEETNHHPLTHAHVRECAETAG